MKLKATCGNCRHEHVFEGPTVNMTNEGCPACGGRYAYSGYTLGIYDESALTPDVMRAIIREELQNVKLSLLD